MDDINRMRVLSGLPPISKKLTESENVPNKDYNVDELDTEHISVGEPMDDYDVDEHDVEHIDIGELDESAPPGQEDWIKANKHNFIKQYGEDKGLAILYALAWKRANTNESKDTSDDSFAEWGKKFAKEYNERMKNAEKKKQEQSSLSEEDEKKDDSTDEDDFAAWGKKFAKDYNGVKKDTHKQKDIEATWCLEDLQNGYNDVNELPLDYDAAGFPDGNDTAAPCKVGGPGNKHGNNPMSTKTAISEEIHKSLVYKYREYKK